MAKATVLEVAALVVLGLLGGVGSYALHPERPYLYRADEPLLEGEITMEMVLDQWGVDGVVWIDARMREKFEDGHLEGAVLLNEQEWDELLFSGTAETIFDSAEKPMVVYCGSYACKASKQVAGRMQDEMGVPEVYFLRGGWRSIQEAGLKASGGAAGGRGE